MDQSKQKPPKLELIQPFIDGTKQTFETAARIKIRRTEVCLKSGYEMSGDISAVIGLGGVTAGTCAVSMTAGLAVAAVNHVLMLSDKENVTGADVRDGVGEMINMIADRGVDHRLLASSALQQGFLRSR